MTSIRPCLRNVVITILLGIFFTGFVACNGEVFDQIKQTTSPTDSVGSPDYPKIEAENQIENYWDGDSDFYQTIAMVLGESQVVLFQPQTKRHQLIQFDPQLFTPQRVNKITDECNLLIQMQSGDRNQIVQVDSNGENLKTLYSLPIREDSSNIFSPVISPSQDYVSYVVFSGEQYYDTAQFQDVEIAPLDGSSSPVRLTEHGGSAKDGGTWSRDGNIIAYTDYDFAGILQVYITEVDKWSEKKLTNFHEKLSRASSIEWSPSDQLLAVIIENASQMDEIWVVSVTGDHYYKITIPTGIREIDDELFWSQDGKTLLTLGSDFENPEITGIYWFDIEKNQLIEYLSEGQARKISANFQTFAFLFPLSTDLSQVAFYNSMGLWQYYDARKGVLANLSWLTGYEWGSHIIITTFKEDLFRCK